MKRISIIAALAICGSAHAADMPLKAVTQYTPAANWSRCYLGVNGGYGWNITGVNIDLSGAPIDLGSVPHGFMGGGQVGCDRQLNDYLVLGVIADIDVANMRASGQIGNGLLTASNLTNYLGTLSARGGITIGNHSLLFFEGGLAYGGAKPNFQFGTIQQGAADTSVGWNFGGGLETKLPAFPGWTAFIKGGYMDLGAKSLTLDTGNGVLATSSNPLKFGYGKVGLNYAIFGN